eukprot:jgi/Ulvmu1/9130/UM005_0226.1
MSVARKCWSSSCAHISHICAYQRVRWASSTCPRSPAPQSRPPQLACVAQQESASTAEIVSAIEASVGKLSRLPMVPPPKPVTLVISGPSGVGKDYLVTKLQERRPDLHFVVTATTRPMRAGERDGVDYHFVSKEIFEQWIADDELFEHALVYGQYKGIPKSSVIGPLSKGQDVVLRLDVQGAATVRRLLPDTVSVYIVAASEAELVERLVRRKTEGLEGLATRAGTIKRECERIGEFQYVVVNEEGGAERAVRQLSAIVDAERCRPSR